MALKRKLSDSEISTSSSLLSSPLSASNGMSIDLSYHSHIATPSLFASRTRKRHRDNRPSDSEVHPNAATCLPTYLFPPLAIASAGSRVFSALEFSVESTKQSPFFLARADGVFDGDATGFANEQLLGLPGEHADSIAAHTLDVPCYQLRRLRCVAWSVGRWVRDGRGYDGSRYGNIGELWMHSMWKTRVP
ncbi:ORF21 protein [Diplocarpon rosae]|nr:ORF21 protein [Diplocarpon rosae]